MERHNKDWTREEHVLAFNLYCKIPFGSIHMNNPRIVELARILGRKVGSVSLKLSNFARLDPALQARGIRGMKHGAKGEEEVWHEFANRPEELAKVPEPVTVFSAEFDRYFKVFRQGPDLYQSEYQLDAKGEMLFESTQKLEYYVGGGMNGYTYLEERRSR